MTRRRIGRACDPCHARRARCSGDSPSCTRCIEFDLQCHYSLSVRQYKAAERRRKHPEILEAPHDQAASSGTDVAELDTPSTVDDSTLSPKVAAHNNLDELLGCDSSTVRRHIDAFFEYIYPVPTFNFLHRADFIRQYSSGEAPPALLLAVCGAASRFLPDSAERTALTISWIDRSESIILRSLGRFEVVHVQTMMILLNFRAGNHQMGKATHLLALASRAAYMLKLNKEDSGLPFVTQESRRRLMWSIYTSDRFSAGGISEFILCPTSSIHIQLPCRERYFEFDTAVSTEHLRDKERSKSELSLSAFILRILDVRSQILQYTKGLLEAQSIPEQYMFQSFEKDLQDIYESIPNELLFSARGFEVRAYSPTRINFLALHLYWHHCHCELYRILNPGYREALPTELIERTSPEFVAYAQSSCLRHALAIGDMISSTYHLVNGVYISDYALGVNLYQASCAILYACHREKLDPEIARGYFNAFIETLKRFSEYFPKFNIYLDDIQNMLKSIDKPDEISQDDSSIQPSINDQEPSSRARHVLEQTLELNRSRPIQPDSLNRIDFTGHVDGMAPLDHTVMDPAAGFHIDGHSEQIAQHPTAFTFEGQESLFWPYEQVDNTLTGNYEDFGWDPHQTILWDWADALPRFS